ncbi:MAG: hypothetical protein V5804_16595 [Mucilaginibacter sp.]|uniref:hypothetical protein n=1 Tax=Mucilaginibacter sp. TaxID=1882438 RepID=UPI0034E4C427
MKNWKKLLICCVSFVLAYFANVAVDLACGGEIDPYDYYISFYHNNLQGEKGYGSFYFTNYQYLFDEEEPASEKDINADEWAAYLRNPVKTADVKKAMYGLDSAGNAAVNQQLLGGKRSMPDSLQRNTFLDALSLARNQRALQYYRFAKEVEPIANFSYNLWEPTPVDTLGLRNAAEKALGFASAEKDAFLKLRYAYQAQRLFHYGKDFEKAKQVYARFINPNPSKSHVQGWALALKAGEERRLGDTLQSAYLFSKVFADYPKRRVQAYRNYHYINVKADNVLQLAKTDAEKAVIYAIDGFGKPEIGMDDLEKVYQFQPNSPMVGVLLVREVNKLEEYYLTNRLNNLTDSAARSQVKSKLISAENTQAKSKNSFGWVLLAGSFLLIVGIVGLIIKNKSVKTVPKLVYGFLLFAGAGLLVYTFFIRQKAMPAARSMKANPAFFTRVPDSVQTKYNQYAERLISFCDQLSAEKKYPEAGIGNLTKAYLWWMQSKAAEGFKAIEASEKEKLNPKLQGQQQIIKLLLSAQIIQQVDSVNENNLLPSLKWLDGKVKSTPVEVVNNSGMYDGRINRFATTSRDFYQHILAPAYLRQGDTTRAALALLKSDSYNAGLNNYSFNVHSLPDFWYRYLRSKPLQQLVSWKEHQPETPWVQFLTSELTGVSTDDLYNLLGTAFLREHNYSEAVTAFAHQKNKAKRSIDESSEELGNPFLEQLNDYPKTFAAAGSGCTKPDFAKAMAALQNKIKASSGNPQLYYQYATALYNTSTYGNSSYLISYDWSSMDYARKTIYSYDTDYIKTSNARQYFLKARALSTDADFKAKCTFSAAKCWQKEQELPDYLSIVYNQHDAAQQNYSKKMRRNPYFKQLEPYKQTSFFKTAVGECSYLKDFLAGR